MFGSRNAQCGLACRRPRTALWELLLLVLIVYVPFLHEPFGTFSLPPVDWAIVIILALTISPVLELRSG